MSSVVASVTCAGVVAPSIAANAAPFEAAPDPVLIAIEAHRRVFAEYEAALEVAGKIEDAMGDAARDHVRLEFGVKRIADHEIGSHIVPRLLFSHEEIDELVDCDLNYFADVLTQEGRRDIQRQRAELHAALDADKEWLDREQTRAGLKSARERADHLIWRERELLEAVCHTAPSTPAGMLALLRFRKEIPSEMAEREECVSMVEQALTIFARASEATVA
jgi:hypothetical protein